MLKLSLAFISSVLLVSPSVFALNTLSNFENSSLNIPNQVAQGNTSEISESVYELSKQITVEITTNDNRGSGTLLSKNNNTYLVLTNAHVINNNKIVTLKTYDGKTYQGTLVNNSLVDSISDNYDLVVIEFTSEEEYSIPTDSINTPSQDFPVIAGGYVTETGEYLVTEGKVTHNLTKSFQEGYSIGYINNIKQGMSGGPILNNMGELIGINGRSAHAILNIGYVYEDETIPTDEQIEKYRQVSWGIPINTLLTYIKDEIAIAYNLPLPQEVAKVETESYVGYPAEIEEKAQKFVVRINSIKKQNGSKGENGSGVIIAKEGNIYTVLTANHVLCGGKIWGDCPDYLNYTITTHDGETRELNQSTIIRQEGVDLAVFKFKSNDNYAVAELADYNPNKDNTDNFVFAAGFPKIGNDDPQWLFSGGRVEEKEQGILQIRQSDLSNEQSGALQGVASLTGGYELVYSSITYGGMGGGAVLDAQGRVIGIHGRAEGANDKSITHLGYSLGIPIGTFVALQDRFKAKAQFLTTAQPRISEQQQEDINKAIVETEIPNTRAEAKIWIERGGQLWRLKRLDEAVEAFDKAIKQNNPDNVYFAWYGKGQALFNKKEFGAAIGALEQAINALPDMARVSDNKQERLEELQSSILLRQGAAYRYLEEYEKALGAINESITLSPNNPNLYNEKWGVLDKLERYEEALAAINQAIKLAPRAAFYNNRGSLYKNRQKYDLALSDYNQALTFNPQDAVAYNNRGILYQEQKQYDLALSDYNQALKFNPQDAVAYYNRGNLYQEQKQYDLALSDYNQALKFNPQYIDAYNNRGFLYKEQKQYDSALSDFNQAIEINEQFAEAYNNRGNLYKEQQQYDLALSDYTQALNINPQDAMAYYNRGIIYQQQQQYDLALSDYTQAIKVNPQFAQAYNNRGIIYKEQKQYDSALSDYTQAIKVNPQFAQAYNNRGNLYNKHNQYNLAISDYTQAININPQYADAYHNRGSLYSDQKQYDLALSDFNKAIKVNPQYADAYQNRAVSYALTKQFQKALSDAEKAADLYEKQTNEAGFQKAQKLLNLIRQAMNEN